MDRANMITTPTKYNSEKTTHYEIQHNPSTSDGLFVKASHITVPKRQSTKLRRSTKRTPNKSLNRRSTQVLKQPQRKSQTFQQLSRSQTTLRKSKSSITPDKLRRRLTIAPNKIEHKPSTATSSSETQKQTTLGTIQFPAIDHQDHQDKSSNPLDNHDTFVWPVTFNKDNDLPSTNTRPTEIKQLNNLESIPFPEIEHQEDQNQNINSPSTNDYQTALVPAASEKESNGNILILTAVSYKENDKAEQTEKNDKNEQLNQQASKSSENSDNSNVSTESLENSEDEHEIRSAFSNFTFSTNRKITTFDNIIPTQIKNTVQSEQSSQVSQLSLLTNQASTTSSIQNKEKTKETDETISVQREEDNKSNEATSKKPVEETQDLQPVPEHGKLYTAACNMAKFVKEHPIAVVAGVCTLAAGIYFGTAGIQQIEAGIQQIGSFADSQWQNLLAMISTITLE